MRKECGRPGDVKANLVDWDMLNLLDLMLDCYHYYSYYFGKKIGGSSFRDGSNEGLDWVDY